jgi:hypothetical protein
MGNYKHEYLLDKRLVTHFVASVRHSEMLVSDHARSLDSNPGRENQLSCVGRRGGELFLATLGKASSDEKGDAADEGVLGDRRRVRTWEAAFAGGAEQGGEMANQAGVPGLALLPAAERLAREQASGRRTIGSEAEGGADSQRDTHRRVLLTRAGRLDPNTQVSERLLEDYGGIISRRVLLSHVGKGD